MAARKSNTVKTKQAASRSKAQGGVTIDLEKLQSLYPHGFEVRVHVKDDGDDGDGGRRRAKAKTKAKR